MCKNELNISLNACGHTEDGTIENIEKFSYCDRHRWWIFPNIKVFNFRINFCAVCGDHVIKSIYGSYCSECSFYDKYNNKRITCPICGNKDIYNGIWKSLHECFISTNDIV